MSKIKFHPFFIIYIFICLYFNWFNDVFYYVVSVILHEYGHYYVSRLLGYESQGIIFNVYGAGLNTSSVYKRSHDILISLAGPFVNLCLIVITVCLWWLFPSIYLYSYGFVKANFMVMILNLIPIYPFDGGRVLVSLLTIKFKRKKIIKINNIISWFFIILLLSLFVFSIFIRINFGFLFISLFLLMNTLVYKKSDYFNQVKSYLKNNDKPCEVKVYKVDEFNKRDILKLISPNYFSIFIKIDNKERRVLTEDDIFKIK